MNGKFIEIVEITNFIKLVVILNHSANENGLTGYFVLSKLKVQKMRKKIQTRKKFVFFFFFCSL